MNNIAFEGMEGGMAGSPPTMFADHKRARLNRTVYRCEGKVWGSHNDFVSPNPPSPSPATHNTLMLIFYRDNAS